MKLIAAFVACANAQLLDLASLQNLNTDELVSHPLTFDVADLNHPDLTPVNVKVFGNISPDTVVMIGGQ